MPRPKGSNRKKISSASKRLWIRVAVVLVVLIMVSVGLIVALK